MPDYPKVPQQISDPISENLERLAVLFPAAVKDGALDLDALRAELGDFEEIKPGDETYELNWVGKQAAKKESFKPLLGKTLALKDDGKNSETTQNLYIEGDNLEALKLLRQNYYGEVKMIYIDPPYNTGNDFVYTDKFTTSIEESELEEGAITVEGRRLIKNEKSSNRYHARWLDMIYPRLKIAKDLLRENGVIFISIDDNEVANLKCVADEVFGEENFIGTFVWDGGRKNDARLISSGHDYILVYARSEFALRAAETRWRERKPGLDLIYKTAEEILAKCGTDYEAASKLLQEWYATLPRDSPACEHSHYRMLDNGGPWYGDNISSPNYRKNLIFEFRGYQPPKNGWRYDPNAMERLEKEGLLFFPKDTSKRIQYKRYLRNTEFQSPKSVFYIDRRAASKELAALLGDEVFDFPKSPQLLQRLIDTITTKDDLILDFFSGSATTAQAVMQLNSEDGGKRRYIMIQYPEVCTENSEAAKNGYKTIAEIGKERIRRAGEKIKEELKAKHIDWKKKQQFDSQKGGRLELDDAATEETNPYIIAPDTLDIGFKSFRIEDTKINWLKKDLRGEQLEFSDTTTQDALDFVPGYTDTDVVYELMLRQSNIPLTGTITKPIATAKRTYLYADAYLVCLEEKITQKLVESLAAVEPPPNKYFFRDSAFGTDIALKDETFRRLKAEIHKHHGDLGAAYTVEFI